MNNRISVLNISLHSVLNDLSVLMDEDTIINIHTAHSNTEIRFQLEKRAYDIVLIDELMKNHLHVLRNVKEMYPHKKTALHVTEVDERYLVDALSKGADGFIIKTQTNFELARQLFHVHKNDYVFPPLILNKLVSCIRSYAFGHQSDDYLLTRREQEIVYELSKGLSYKMIAENIGVKVDTVRSHIRSIYQKMGVNSKSQVILKSFSHRSTLVSD